MPNTKSAEKRVRNNHRKHECNRAVISRVRTLEKSFLQLVVDKKREAASSALISVISAYDKASKQGVLHRNRANQKKSRLTRLFHTIRTESEEAVPQGSV